MDATSLAIDDFWRWFQAHQASFESLISADAPFYDEAVGQLKQLHESLWFEFCQTDASAREFIITAGGESTAFSTVESIVARAPKVAGWQFIALKPAQGFDFKTEYEGHEFDPKTMWFQPLTNRSRPEDLGIRVGIPNFDPSLEQTALSATFVILDTALGERAAALELQFVGVVALPENPEATGYHKLTQLPEYLDWRRRKQMQS